MKNAAANDASSKTPGTPLPDASESHPLEKAVLTLAQITATVDVCNEQTISGSLLRATTKEDAMKHKVLAALGAMISVIGMSIAAAAPASANPLEHDHFVDSGGIIAQVADPLFCAGIVDFPVFHEWNAKGMVLLVERGDGLIYGKSAVQATDIWTNTLNDKAVTITRSGQDRDKQVTDNGDGTVTIEVAVSGVQKAYGPDGERLFIDAGTFGFEILLDTAGTPADPSDDQFIEFLGETGSHGRMDTMNRDFCQDLVTFIG